MDRHQGLPRAFDLSRLSYFLDFALVPLAAAWLLVTSPEPLARTLALAIAGVLVWTLAEYWIHRLVFHGRTPFEPMHQMHHRLPKDLIGVASWGTFAGFAFIWLVCGAAFTAGFMLGYLVYCAIHVRMHHGDPVRFGSYVAFMHRHHAGHHRGGRGNFGVSVPVWDFVFGSYRKASK